MPSCILPARLLLSLSSFVSPPSLPPSICFRSLMMPISLSSAVWWWMTLSVCWTTSPSVPVSPTWSFRLCWCCWRKLHQRCISTLYIHNVNVMLSTNNNECILVSRFQVPEIFAWSLWWLQWELGNSLIFAKYFSIWLGATLNRQGRNFL